MVAVSLVVGAPNRTTEETVDDEAPRCLPAHRASRSFLCFI